MILKINNNEITVTRSGTYLVTDQIVYLDKYKGIDKIDLIDDDGNTTTYSHPEFIGSRWIGNKYHISFREISEEELMKAADEAAIFIPNFLPSWMVGMEYKIGNRLVYDGVIYKVLQDHTSQADWTPDKAVSLYARTDGKVTESGEIETEEYPEWVQPTGSTDAYAKDAKVTHNDKKWTSDLDANVWEPGVYGWTEVTE